MRLELKRIALKPTYTIGRLYVNGAYFCDTLEDKVCDLNKNGKFDDGEVKIAGETAIPYRKYAVAMNVISPKYSKKKFYYDNCHGGRLPRLLNVPHFEGILIHCGNTAADSAGCILVGENKVVGKVINSQQTFLRLYDVMWKAYQKNESITIEIV